MKMEAAKEARTTLPHENTAEISNNAHREHIYTSGASIHPQAVEWRPQKQYGDSDPSERATDLSGGLAGDEGGGGVHDGGLVEHGLAVLGDLDEASARDEPAEGRGRR